MGFIAPLLGAFGAAGSTAGTLGTVAGLAGAGLSAVGALSQGAYAKAQGEYQAKQAEMQADEARAAGQREAANQYRQQQLIASQQIAGIAGSGGDITDASVIDLMGDAAVESDLNRRTVLYRAENAARGYDDAATNARISGENAQTASYFNAGTNLFTGLSSMYSRFGQPLRKNAAATNATAPLYGGRYG